MMERENQTIGVNEKRLLNVSELCAYTGLGRNKGMEFAKEIGAMVKIGRRSLFDKVKIDNAIDEMTDIV